MSLRHAAVNAAGAGAGDEVICDPIVQFGAMACLYNNAHPVFADVDADSYLLDPRSVRNQITPHTKAIIVTHLWGYPADVAELRRIADEHGLVLIEDAAHAQLAKFGDRYVGNWGHVGIFSFNHGKQMSTGDGGVAICSDDRVERRIRSFLIFGESPVELAWNFRMNELTAAVASAEAERLPAYMEVYNANTRIYDEAIGGCAWLLRRAVVPGSQPVGYFYSRRFAGDRQGLAYDEFKRIAAETGPNMEFGFTQVPPYRYQVFLRPLAYANKGCPLQCQYYKGKYVYKEGLCPNAEAILPRLVYTAITVGREASLRNAELWRKVIDRAEGR
jgi:perosamine synthetase